MIKKKIAATIVIFILLITIIPFTENVRSCDCGDPPCWPELSGTMGENNWYVSSVHVGFNGSYTQIMYRIDGSSWTTYTAPFLLTTEGVHVFEWTCDSNMSNISSIEIKIDMYPPELSNITRKHLGIFKWQFNVNASDEFSGVNRVQFSIDNSIDSEPPYQHIWRGCMLLFRLRCNFDPSFCFMHSWNAWDNAGNCYHEGPSSR